ncbi:MULTISPECIES: hypothetical protein [Paenarthrobacter]|nr:MULTISPECIES: hypothetical protein [Paenarthrobacter]
MTADDLTTAVEIIQAIIRLIPHIVSAVRYAKAAIHKNDRPH